MPQYDSESIFLWVPACNLFWSFVLTFYSQLPIKQAILLTFNSFLRKRYQQVLFRWLQQPHPQGVSPWRKWEDITRQDLKDIDVGQWFNDAVISWRALCRRLLEWVFDGQVLIYLKLISYVKFAQDSYSRRVWEKWYKCLAEHTKPVHLQMRAIHVWFGFEAKEVLQSTLAEYIITPIIRKSIFLPHLMN